MNYQKIYNDIIERGKLRILSKETYKENKGIPRSQESKRKEKETKLRNKLLKQQLLNEQNKENVIVN